ncbi:MAG: TonB-dependent receptor plug domain-containing protein, partial [Gemmatimonadetes bacterium]|nr:TonB-dependent receptor plug domain-containing protein [Gemmatimonadota bacterium]
MRSTGFPTSVLALAGLLLLGGPLSAQQGRITGRVLDAKTALPIASAQVFLEDQSVGTLSSIDGRYVLRDVPVGVQTVIVQMIGYGQKTITGVEVTDGGVAALDISLEGSAVDIAGITVAATVESGSTSALLYERRSEAVVVDAIGSEQISRSPDGDAAAALKRVPGLSVVDGKFAYVRGLGERYSSTTLNGAPLASPMPDRKVVPLDVIPSGLLESIVTAKSYSPDKPGDYAGGLVELRTKDFPKRRIFSVSASGGFNTVTTFEDGLRYGGGGLDFLGFDDGTRDLPGALPDNARVTFPNFSRPQLESLGESFSGDWG